MKKIHSFRIVLTITLTAMVTIMNAQSNVGGAEPGSGTPFAGEFSPAEKGSQEPLSLWYKKSAKEWTEALAVGNGRLGAMVFGGVENERIQLNEDTLWAGGPYDPSRGEALAALPEARRLIFEGKYGEADRVIGEKMMAVPLQQMQYQTVGDLLLNFAGMEEAADYRRELNLDTAIAKVSFAAGQVKFTREVFCSPVDQVIVVRLMADKPGQISFTAGMTTPQNATIKTEGTDTLVMDGVNGASRGIEGKLKFQCRVLVTVSGGSAQAKEDTITVAGADAATLLISAATSYRNYNDVSGNAQVKAKDYIAAAKVKSYEAMRAEHIAEHRRLFRAVEIDLGTSEAAELPTDERIRSFGSGSDPQLAALYFQFGRYLLISSSRPGCQPANLQGIWNQSMNPPWDSKYTVNINTEMNYWPAEPTGLGECVEPLLEMVKDISVTGARTAKVNWGADGWVCHHNTDLWRATAPIDGPAWGFWPTGGAWLCRHLWEHYEYNTDKQYLAKVYPLMKGAAVFFLDTLVEEPKSKWLVTCPSLSPENTHKYGTSICAGPTMDMQIIRDLFTNCISAAKILDTDEELSKKFAQTRDRLAPNQIGKEGQLQEWLEDWDMEARDLHHRHVSHLYGLYPSEQINVFDTPELAAAARKTLEIRGDEATGWGIGWRLNLWARLHDGEHAYKIIQMLLRPGRTYPNMFDAHPPFQIDGNFGGTSGIAEMLMQSRTLVSGEKTAGQIELLPAITKAWPKGKVTGLRAKGGFEIDIEWDNCKVTSAVIKSMNGNACKIRYGDKVIEPEIKAGQKILLNGQMEIRGL